MSLQELLIDGGVYLFASLTLIQIVPIKINPWSAIAKALGKAINAEVLSELGVVKKSQQETSEKLEQHIRADDERDADMHRYRVLQFSNELLRNIPHSQEDFIEILAEIDEYERYCGKHEEYENNRAGCAVDNIKRVYKARLEKRDFLQ